MRKFIFFTSFEKEEIWLSEMAKQGYKFTKKSISYEFEPAKTENTVIKMDYRTFKKQEDFEDYCALFEDSGWKHITGTKRSGYQYFNLSVAVSSVKTKIRQTYSRERRSAVQAGILRCFRMSNSGFFSKAC